MKNGEGQRPVGNPPSKPTTIGWYWVRRSTHLEHSWCEWQHEDWQIVQIVKDDPEGFLVLMVGDEVESPVDSLDQLDGEWIGPLSPPHNRGIGE